MFWVSKKKLGFWALLRAPLVFALVPVYCGTHEGSKFRFLLGGGQVSALSQPTVKAKPWTVLPSIDQRGAGGLKGFPLAKIFARTREDLVYDSERLMWVQHTGHLGTTYVQHH